jgi:hypothetical protein
MSTHTTVVLFDVENLLGEPANWKQAAIRLSFGDILAKLRGDQSGAIGPFAVSRAYANWAHGALSTLRREMTENGVEPRQIFAFDGGAKKNAADIELVIDALDLAYSRPALTTFVLVTRDGGFASLGRKLHELGKTVVVCADKECSKALRAVADVFVTLPAPDEGIVEIASAAKVPEGDRMLDEARAAVLREVAALTAETPTREGVLLANVGNHFAGTVPSLPAARSAYPGLREFLQWALDKSPYCIFEVPGAPEGARHRLGVRTVNHEGRVLPAFERRPPRVTDRIDVYRLLASQGKSPLRLPNAIVAGDVLRAIARTGIHDEELGFLINRLADEGVGRATTTDVKNVVLVLAQSPLLAGEGAAAPMSDRRYTLAKKASTYPKLRAAVLGVIRDKLARAVEVDEATLQRLVAA